MGILEKMRLDGKASFVHRRSKRHRESDRPRLWRKQEVTSP